MVYLDGFSLFVVTHMYVQVAIHMILVVISGESTGEHFPNMSYPSYAIAASKEVVFREKNSAFRMDN